MDEPGIRESGGWNRRDALKAFAALGAGSIVAVDAGRAPPSGAALMKDPNHASSVWLVGGHLVNTAGGGGNSGNDLPDSIIEMRGERFGRVGRLGALAIPKGARQIDLRGKFVVPGFCDNLASFGNQSQASAHLYFGVTSVVTATTRDDPLRPPTDTSASPAPLDLPIAILFGSDPDGHVFTRKEMRAQVASRLAGGAKVLDIHYSVTDEQLQILDGIPRKGFAYAAELASAHYADAVKVANCLLHTVRYFIGLAPTELQQEIAREPFNPAITAKLIAFYEGLDVHSPAVLAYSEMLAAGQAALMPSMALDYYSGFRSKDSFSDWWEQQAHRYGITGIPNPSNGVKGDPAPPLVPNPARMAALYALERVNAQSGAKYLVGSAASRLGTLPGVSYAVEMQLMAEKLGLTPRQVLAAATTNFDEAYGFNLVGAIKPGYQSDAVVLHKDPTADVNIHDSIDAVVRSGRYLRRNEILVPRA